MFQQLKRYFQQYFDQIEKIHCYCDAVAQFHGYNSISLDAVKGRKFARAILRRRYYSPAEKLIRNDRLISLNDLFLIEYLGLYVGCYFISRCARYIVDRILRRQTKRRLEPGERLHRSRNECCTLFGIVIKRASVFLARARADFSPIKRLARDADSRSFPKAERTDFSAFVKAIITSLVGISPVCEPETLWAMSSSRDNFVRLEPREGGSFRYWTRADFSLRHFIRCRRIIFFLP